MDDCLYLLLQSLSSGLALLQVSGNLIRLTISQAHKAGWIREFKEAEKQELSPCWAVEILKYTRPKPFNPMSSAFDPRGS